MSLLPLFFLREATYESVDEHSEVLDEDDDAEESLETPKSLRLLPIL